MPTATAFDAAARTFDGVADELALLMASTPSHFGPDTLAGGTLTLLTELTISTVDTTAARAAKSLRALADECRRRAVVCRSFEADLAAYRREQRDYEASDPSLAPSGPPTRPTRPAVWVDV